LSDGTYEALTSRTRFNSVGDHERYDKVNSIETMHETHNYYN